jgi:hypothetical protein
MGGKTKRERPPAPTELLSFDSADKGDHIERWTRGRSLLDFPKPFRLMLAGGPGSGKSRAIKNVLYHAQIGRKPFTRVLLWHYDPDTREYESVDGLEVVSSLPDLEYFHEQRVAGRDRDGDDILKPHRTLLIIDDIDLTAQPKDVKEAANRLFGYVSTHCGVSIMIAVQGFLEMVPREIRNMMNVYCLWRPNDLDALGVLGRRVGIKKDLLVDTVKRHLLEPTDSLWVDMSMSTPAKYRINGLQAIELG